MTRRQRRAHLAAWLIVAPAALLLVLLAWGRA